MSLMTFQRLNGLLLGPPAVGSVGLSVCVYVCVCVCEREREGGRTRKFDLTH